MWRRRASRSSRTSTSLPARPRCSTSATTSGPTPPSRCRGRSRSSPVTWSESPCPRGRRHSPSTSATTCNGARRGTRRTATTCARTRPRTSAEVPARTGAATRRHGCSTRSPTSGTRSRPRRQPRSNTENFAPAPHRSYDRVISTEGWIFMVGFRVFDVGLLILWLVWFFRLRDDDDDQPDDGGPGGGGNGPKRDDGPKGGGGLRKRLAPGPRLRDHWSPRPVIRPRGAETIPHVVPMRVRTPRSPDAAPRRA